MALLVFVSEYEYERHLVTKHLIGSVQSNSLSRFKKNSFLEPPLHSWTQYDSVVNMAAILNDPTDRQLDIFSRYWGEAFERAAVPPLRFPIITEEHFFTYLSILSKRKKFYPIPQTPSTPRHSDMIIITPSAVDTYPVWTQKRKLASSFRIHNKQFPSNPTIHTKEFVSGSVQFLVVELALNHDLAT
ncbi:hypothetical protein ACTXT7_006550 [Hymenolepis weldensis]